MSKMKALLLLLFVTVFGEDTLVYREEDGNFVEKDELDGDDVQDWSVQENACFFNDQVNVFCHSSMFVLIVDSQTVSDIFPCKFEKKNVLQEFYFSKIL